MEKENLQGRENEAQTYTDFHRDGKENPTPELWKLRVNTSSQRNVKMKPSQH